MKQTLNRYQFVDQFRQIRPDNFSAPALAALFDYYEEIEADTGEEIEFDPIAICCDWSEFETALAAASEYGFEPDDAADAEEQEETALEWLRDNGQVIEMTGGGVIVSGI